MDTTNKKYETVYLLYAKPEGAKKFSPVDCHTGNLVINLIYATMFSKESGEKALKAAKEQNPTVKFELRPNG